MPNEFYGVLKYKIQILMYDSGVRIREIPDLRVYDIWLGNTLTTTLMGKGGKMN